ncbi:MAG: sensor histidine kinase [Bacteroidota bacterium]
MHPILADAQNRLIYLVAWTIIGLLLAALLAIPGDLPLADAVVFSVPLALVYGFVCLSARYLCGAFPIERTHWLQLLTIHLIAAGLSSALWILFMTLWGNILAQVQMFSALAELPAVTIRIWFGSGMLLFLLAVAVHYLIAAFEASRDAERRSLELRILAQSAELRTLRTQIHPHFLFNSLNSISALTSSDPAGARAMTLRLAGFLRTTLSLGAKDAITLPEEISLVNEYLAIERVRFGSRLQVECSIEPEIMENKLPPLLLQPLIENAIKHGIAHLIEGGTITIRATGGVNRMKIAITNPLDADTGPMPGAGLGIRNVKERLERLYGNDARIDIARDANSFTVELIIPFV